MSPTHWIFTGIFLSCFIYLIQPVTTPSWADQIEFDHADETIIYFKNSNFLLSNLASLMPAILPLTPPSILALTLKKEPPLTPIHTNLFHLRYLGKIQSQKQEIDPYFIFTAKPCLNCQEESAIYLLRAKEEKPLPFLYPGKIIDPQKKTVLLESRGFFGQCLSFEKNDVLVFFQKEKVDRHSKLQASILIAKPAENFLSEQLLERRLPLLAHTLKYVKKKKCKEIEIKKRFMPDQPLSLKIPKKNNE